MNQGEILFTERRKKQWLSRIQWARVKTDHRTVNRYGGGRGSGALFAALFGGGSPIFYSLGDSVGFSLCRFLGVAVRQLGEVCYASLALVGLLCGGLSLPPVALSQFSLNNYTNDKLI
ncbi:Uncharacterized protein TCM_011577 [Theobroma cacao]|uniref:Uncharacterized protein n=1 Tax=Theobroma cacao TaxID=3641 RepID=A0A061EBJ4_THECC|nr:Uncharacterized protein TCM_011577 [Theobroma cacao]